MSREFRMHSLRRRAAWLLTLPLLVLVMLALRWLAGPAPELAAEEGGVAFGAGGTATAGRAPAGGAVQWVNATLQGPEQEQAQANSLAQEQAQSLTQSGMANEAAGAVDPADLPRTAAEAEREQRAARDAVLQALGQPPVQGHLAARPAWVSEVEWQVLTALARQKGDYDRELARLVNSLRFNKLLEAWREPGLSTATRRTLGTQLLAELPERVRQGDYGRAPAEALQRELLRVLEPDPAARATRAAAEAQRLKVPLLQEDGP